MRNTRAMTAQDFAVVKLAAAARFSELNIRPATAQYVFERFTAKQAKVIALRRMRERKITKLAQCLSATISKVNKSVQPCSATGK
jgi:hypothetical protein